MPQAMPEETTPPGPSRSRCAEVTAWPKRSSPVVLSTRTGTLAFCPHNFEPACMRHGRRCFPIADRRGDEATVAKGAEDDRAPDLARAGGGQRVLDAVFDVRGGARACRAVARQAEGRFVLNEE